MAAQTTVRFPKGEDQRDQITKACARRTAESGIKVSMNQWILEAITEKLEREKEEGK
jgi:hypothetical protein